jgi:molybdopterin/thiamine biosynthesis adenylyltransferase
MKVKNMPGRGPSFSVAIVGCGGVIGSHGVAHFARIAGIDTITLVDPDRYELHNLRAQNIRPADVDRLKVEVTAEALRDVAPDLKVVSFAERVQSVPRGVLKNCDLIATCLDSKQARLSTNRIAQSVGRPLVDAGVRGDGLLARVSVLPGKGGGACLECSWSPRTYANTRYRQHCVGEATNSPSYLGALIASYQAMESDKLLSGNCEHPMGYQVILDLTHHTLSHSKLFRSAGCRCDHIAWDIRDAGSSPDALTLGDALELGRVRCGPGPLGLSLYGKHIIAALRGPCGHRWPVMRLHHRTSREHRTCPRCSARTAEDALPSPLDIEERFLETRHGCLLGQPLSRFGFRPHDVVTVEGAGGCAHFELGEEDSNTDGRTADDDRSGTDGVSDAAA